MHELEKEYGLTAYQLLDALAKRFRAKVTLEGAVAEEQLLLHIEKVQSLGIIESFKEFDEDGHPDFSIKMPGIEKELLVECKNVRNHNEAYREGGKIVAYKVETQKTRTSNNDRSSRFYDHNLFNILAVCLGKKTGNWTDFMFICTNHLARHKDYSHKLAVMHKVPILNHSSDMYEWSNDLGELLQRHFK